MKKSFALFAMIFALNANLSAPAPEGRYIISFEDIVIFSNHPQLVSVKDKLILYNMFLQSPEKRKKDWFPEIYDNYNSIFIVTYEY